MAAALAAHVDHDRPAVETDRLLVRFMAKVEITSLYGCWLWQASTRGGNRPWDRGGPYGQVWLNGRPEYAHKAVLFLVGRPRPTPDHVPHHRCLVRLCVHPLHLEWMTNADNARLATAERYRELPRANEEEPVW